MTKSKHYYRIRDAEDEIRRCQNLITDFLVPDISMLQESIDPFNERDDKTEKEKDILGKAIKVVSKYKTRIVKEDILI